TMFSRRNALFSLINAAVLTLLASAAHAATINVSAGQSIQAAIDAAAPNDTILIGAGTYHESLNWSYKDLVIRGAGADSTIIDVKPERGGPGGHCLDTWGLSPASRLEGVTLTGGTDIFQDDGYGNLYISDYGNGMGNFGSSPTVVNCVFTDNYLSPDYV